MCGEGDLNLRSINWKAIPRNPQRKKKRKQRYPRNPFKTLPINPKQTNWGGGYKCRRSPSCTGFCSTQSADLSFQHDVHFPLGPFRVFFDSLVACLWNHHLPKLTCGLCRPQMVVSPDVISKQPKGSRASKQHTPTCRAELTLVGLSC